MIDPRGGHGNDSQLNLSSKRAPMKQGLKMGGGVAAYGDQSSQIPQQRSKSSSMMQNDPSHHQNNGGPSNNTNKNTFSFGFR